MLNADVLDLVWSFVLELRVSALNEQIRREYELAEEKILEAMDLGFDPGDRRSDAEYWFRMKPWYSGLDYTDGILKYQSGCQCVVPEGWQIPQRSAFFGGYNI